MTERILWFATAFSLSLLLSLYLTPLVRRGALSFGVLDTPNAALKTHKAPVPYLGGIAVYLAFLLTLSLVFDFGPQVLGLLLGGTMVTMLGLFDDLRVMTPSLKLGGQMLAAWVMLKSDIMIKLVAVPKPFAMALSVLWLVGITNALNIVDVSDALATSCAIVASAALFGVALINGHDLIAVTTLALCGALVGFVFFNRAPARIYLGDTGSLFVGFMLASLSMIGSYTEHSPMGALAPLSILCVPLLDITLVSLARLHQGKSPMMGSPDHFAIRLKHRGWSANRVALMAALLSLVGAGVAGLLIYLPKTYGMAVFGAACVLFMSLLVWLWRMPVPSQP